MTKTQINAILKELGNSSLRINSKIYRTRLNKMIKGIGLYAVGPYTVNRMQNERFEELLKTVCEKLNGVTLDKMPGFVHLEVGKFEVVATLQSVEVGEYVHYYAKFSVR